jgi:hypothetical protein
MEATPIWSPLGHPYCIVAIWPFQIVLAGPIGLNRSSAFLPFGWHAVRIVRLEKFMNKLEINY